jgi:hypothetical protein
MAFTKTSIGITSPTPVESPVPRRGDEKEGQVWDGEKWISKSDWEAANAKGSQLPDGA